VYLINTLLHHLIKYYCQLLNANNLLDCLATRLRCGGIFNDQFVSNFATDEKEDLWKLVIIWQSDETCWLTF